MRGRRSLGNLLVVLAGVESPEIEMELGGCGNLKSRESPRAPLWVLAFARRKKKANCNSTFQWSGPNRFCRSFPAPSEVLHPAELHIGVLCHSIFSVIMRDP